MSPFIVNRIPKERIFILDNELLTKEDLLKKENWKENIRFSSIEDIKYFFDEFINEDKSLRFARNGDVVEYRCNKSIYCPKRIIIGPSEKWDENLGDTKYYKIMEYGECNHDIELLKKRKHLAASDGIEKYKWKIHYFQKDIIKIQEHNARRKKSKKEIEKIIKNNRKKIYGCCNGIRKLLARQGCDSVISNAVIYSLCNDLCSDDGYEDDAMNGNEDGAVDGVVGSTVNGNEDGNEDGTVDGVVDGDQNSNRNVNVSNDRANDILNNTGNINYFDDTAMKKYKRGIALLDTKVKIVRGMWFKNMKDPYLRLICGVNCRNEITCIVPVGGNKEEIMTFPVKKCMSVKGRLDIIKMVMKKAGFHTISDRESDDGYGEQLEEERHNELGGNDSQLVAKRYNTRGYRYDYTTYLKLYMNDGNGHMNEMIEEIIDVMPTFNGLLNTLRDLYLVSYPREMKSYTSFSFSNKSSLVLKKDDMHTMSSTAFVSV